MTYSYNWGATKITKQKMPPIHKNTKDHQSQSIIYEQLVDFGDLEIWWHKNFLGANTEN